MQRPGFEIDGSVGVYAFAATEGAVLGAAPGLVTGGFTPVAVAGAGLGLVVRLVLARWYLSRLQDE